jgi:hypothetical protein
MTPRKASKPNPIDPITLTTAALKAVKTAPDFHRLSNITAGEVLEAAWNKLSQSEQDRITALVNNNAQPTPEQIADELSACGTLIELQGVKNTYGDVAVKAAWRLLPQPERDRLTSICKNGRQPQPEPVTEQPVSSQMESQPVEQTQPQPKTRSLFSVSNDLERLNELLDEAGDDTQQQELINNWLEHLGEERDRKLDNYAALITEMLTRAEVRKAEAKRMMELAQSDGNRAKLLKDRLKWFFEVHSLKTVETARYKLSLAKVGGKVPLILDDSVPVTQMPERFQKISIDPDTTAIRLALEAGELLGFAQLGERSSSIRIK